jgi:hypothetical protein
VPATSSSFTQRWKDSNFVLSQIGTDLLLRMKTSRAGWDRHGYTAYIPGVFSDAKPHQLQISYAGFALRVYIDGRERSLLFDVTPNRYQIVFYVLILVPFALLLSLVANRIPGRLGYLVLVVGSAILPSLVLEELLVSEASRPIRATNVVLGFLIIGGTILTLRRLPAPSGEVKRRATHTS